MKTVLLISVSFWLCFNSFAQDLSSDTASARESLNKAKSLIYFRQFTRLDSILIFSKKSAEIYSRYKMNDGLLASLCIQMQVSARKNNEKLTVAYFDSISNLSTKLSGEKNVYMANAFHNLGIVYQNLNKLDIANENFLKSIEIRRKVSGEKDLDLAQTYINIGLVCESKQNFDLALEYFNKSLNIRKVLLGEKDFNVAQAYWNIGNDYFLRGEWDKSLESLGKSLQIRKEIYGEINADVATCLNSIGLDYDRKREYDTALEYYSKALEIRLAISSGPNVDLAQSYYNVAILSAMKGEYDKALDYQIKTMEMRKSLYGPENIRIAESYLIIGNLYRNKDNFKTALEYTQKCLDLRLKLLGPKHIDVSKAYGNLGLIYFNMSEYDKALENQFKSLDIFKELLGDKHINLATVYNNIASVYNSLSEYDKALDYYTKALELRRENYGENSIEVGDSYYNLSNVYNRKSDFAKDLELNIKALNIYKKVMGEKSLKVADSYNNIGILYNDLSQYDDAQTFLEKALQIKLSILSEENSLVAAGYNNLGVLFMKKSDFEKALKYFQKSLSINSKILDEKSMEVALSYQNMGRIYLSLSEYDKALDFFQKSLKIKEQLYNENNVDVASSYNSIGETYCLKLEFDKGLEYLLKSLDIRKAIFSEKNVAVALSYNSIGAVYQSKSEPEKALSYFLKSLEINKELLGEKSTAVADNYLNIGNIYQDLSNDDKCIEYLQKAKEIYAELVGEQSSEVANCYNNIAVYYDYRGDFEKSLEYNIKALGIRKKVFGEKHSDVVLSCYNIGGVYGKIGDYNKALEYYQKSLYANGRDFTDSINPLLNPTSENCIDYFALFSVIEKKSFIFEILAKNSYNIDLPGLKNVHGSDFYKLSIRNLLLCDKEIDNIRRKITLMADKMSFGDNAKELYEAAIRVSLNLDRLGIKNGKTSYLDLAFYFSEKNKGVVLQEAISGKEGMKFAGIPDSLLEEEHSLKVNIAYLEKQLAVSPEKKEETNFRNLLFTANRQYENLITTFEKRFPEYYNLKYPEKQPTVKEIQNMLDDKTALRTYFEGDSNLYIYTLTNNNLNVSQKEISKNLTDSIIWFRYGLTKSSPRMQEAYRRLGYSLFQYLFPDIKTIPENILNLIIIPDGRLATIPFEALLENEYKGSIDDYKKYPYLINKYNISYSYSANLFYKTFPKKGSSKVDFTRMDDWLAIAPVFDNASKTQTFITTRSLNDELAKIDRDSTKSVRSIFSGGYIAPLPGTLVETEGILGLFKDKNLKASVILHEKANEHFVKSGGISNSKVLHFATHGFVNSEQPDLSGILLAQDTTGGEDGVLYSNEIYNLKLNSDLVLLSACETGLGKIQKGEGIIGLTRALLYAGSKNIIVSLWSVGDQSTSDLMLDFYKNFLDNYKSSSYSLNLRNAKLKMIKEGTYSHPLYWSPFILIGK